MYDNHGTHESLKCHSWCQNHFHGYEEKEEIGPWAHRAAHTANGGLSGGRAESLVRRPVPAAGLRAGTEQPVGPKAGLQCPALGPTVPTGVLSASYVNFEDIGLWSWAVQTTDPLRAPGELLSEQPSTLRGLQVFPINSLYP